MQKNWWSFSKKRHGTILLRPGSQASSPDEDNGEGGHGELWPPRSPKRRRQRRDMFLVILFFIFLSSSWIRQRVKDVKFQPKMSRFSGCDTWEFHVTENENRLWTCLQPARGCHHYLVECALDALAMSQRNQCCSQDIATGNGMKCDCNIIVWIHWNIHGIVSISFIYLVLYNLVY